VANGELWLLPDGPELRRHNPESRLLSFAKYNYDPNAECPVFGEMLLMMFPDPEERRHLLELMAYAIQPQRWLKIVVLALGGGYNSKSPLFNTLYRRLLGDDGVGVLDISSIDDDRWAAAQLVGKRVGVEDDMRKGAQFPDQTMKLISQQNVLSAEFKGKDRFDFVVRAVPHLIGNNAPYIRDLTAATRERLQVFRFKHRFDHAFDEPVVSLDPDGEPSFEDGSPAWWGYSKRDADALWTAVFTEELPGVLNLLVHHYYRLRERGDIDVPAACQEARDVVVREGNPVAMFVHEACEPAPPNAPGVRASVIYENFVTWHAEAIGSGGKRIGGKQFNERLRDLGYRVDVSGGYTMVWGLHSPPPELEQEPTIDDMSPLNK